MDKELFKEFLINNCGYSKSVSNERCSFCNTCERKLCNIQHLALDLNQVVLNDSIMANALALIPTVMPTKAQQYQNSLRLYYYYKNSTWFDFWRSRIKNCESKTNHREIDYQIPSKVGDGEECFNEIIQYAEGVSDSEKIPGLRKFLLKELDKIISFATQAQSGNFNEYRHFPMIPIVLSNELPVKDFDETDEYIASKIDKSDKTYDEILKILKNRRKTDRILGEYYHSGGPVNSDYCFHFPDESVPYIVIYYKNTITPDYEEYEYKLGNCLAHEYFHFIHDIAAGTEFSKKNAKATAVQEALAEFFSVIYSLKMNILAITLEKVVKEKYVAWSDRRDSGWPYAYAHYFYLIDGKELNWTVYLPDYQTFGSFNKFIQVFDVSCGSMNEAYKLLIKK